MLVTLGFINLGYNDKAYFALIDIKDNFHSFFDKDIKKVIIIPLITFKVIHLHATQVQASKKPL